MRSLGSSVVAGLPLLAACLDRERPPPQTCAVGAPAVEVTDGALRLRGCPRFLFGGELQYFRVRDPGFDAERTRALWNETLDRMRAAGMNLVTTYVPWDYHNPAPGVWDFAGARDVAGFLRGACDRGMVAIVKPGPLITAEWPRGLSSFGAVPIWWKDAHPEALVRDARGDFFTYLATGDPAQRQPTFLHPTFLAAVREWYARAAAVLRPLAGSCIVGVQIDNETNLYWGERFGEVDYSPTALAHYRGFLADRHGTIAALDARYGTDHGSFDDVDPPASRPLSAPEDRRNAAWYRDWYEAGLAYVGDYLARLKGMLLEEGLGPPAILLLTNDSPFSLTAPSGAILRNVLVHDGPTKNRIALAALDLYTKIFASAPGLHDAPFQADYFTRLFDHYGDLATGPQPFAFSVELQGGFVDLPFIGAPDVRPEATEQLLARTIGRGLKGGSIYVVRDGLNLDGSPYDYRAAIGRDGRETPRYRVLSRWGDFLARHGEALLGARAVTNAVTILVNGATAAPLGGLRDDLQRFTAVDLPALFGWLASAGLDPEVRDARLTSPQDLAGARVVFHASPGFVDDRSASLLTSYAEEGGVLVLLLWPGGLNEILVETEAARRLAALFPARAAGVRDFDEAPFSGVVEVAVPGYRGPARGYRYLTRWEANGAPIEPFAWESDAPEAGIVGYVSRDSRGVPRALLGANVWAPFNQGVYYEVDPGEIAAATALGRYLASLGGEGPILETGRPREIAWARRAGSDLYVFVVNDNAEAARVAASFTAFAALGLREDRTYEARDCLRESPLTTATGAALRARGLEVPVPAWGSAVVCLRSR